ncbi:MAG: hypothetical protein K5874_07370 [Bacteroidaceae bacterium]|nr:hypothetical protein [Bacteroidaceae bacterium]
MSECEKIVPLQQKIITEITKIMANFANIAFLNLLVLRLTKSQVRRVCRY